LRVKPWKIAIIVAKRRPGARILSINRKTRFFVTGNFAFPDRGVSIMRMKIRYALELMRKSAVEFEKKAIAPGGWYFGERSMVSII
jgi:hypothetical protein